MRKTAFGVLKWTPSEFWSSTPHDLLCAVVGLNEAGNPNGLTEEQVSDLKRMLDEDSHGNPA